jgi:hypothetical protein
MMPKDGSVQCNIAIERVAKAIWQSQNQPGVWGDGNCCEGEYRETMPVRLSRRCVNRPRQ